jgi:hypothetical protein
MARIWSTMMSAVLAMLRAMASVMMAGLVTEMPSPTS